MNRVLWIFVILVALMTACSVQVDSNEVVKVTDKGADSVAVGFNVYVNRGTTTKAGYAGELTTDVLKRDSVGFGVLAYYGNGALYNETSKPDFMYNQLVSYNTSANTWTYSPVKYWPNEFGAQAGSESADRLSFFAYAPYVKVTPSTGVAVGEDGIGILGLTRNIAQGDPLVMYGANLLPGAGVDLCWGVSASEFKSSVDGESNRVAKGYPFLNLIKTKTGDRLPYEFNHALAQLNVQVDADIDNAANIDGKTTVYVRSVTFNGFAMQGSLNLNSNTSDGPIWYDISGTGKLKRDPVTVYDGRTDGMEGVVTATDMSEKPATLNPKIVQSRPYSDTPAPGVTTEAVNLFNAADDPADPTKAVNAPVMVIPTQGVPLSVTIVYDIETMDEHLSGFLSDGVTHGVSVENRITKQINLTNGDAMILSAGKKYVISLHLGLTSVKFDATVADWDNTSYTAGADLPANVNGLGSITITDPTTGSNLTDTTFWRSGTFPTPVFKVWGDDGSDVTDKSSLSWESSDENVATVASDGSVTLKAPGTTSIKLTATYKTQSLSKAYTLNVNEVTGLSVTPAASNIVIGGSLLLKATLEINGGTDIYGSITDIPAVSWSSNYDKVSVTPRRAGAALVVSADATAFDAAESAVAKVAASVGTPYAASALSDTSTLTCVAKIAIKSVDLSVDTTTVWFQEGATLPTVKVMGTDNQELTTGVTLSWAAKNPGVATYDPATGISFVDYGKAVFEVTATLAESATTVESTKTAAYTVFVNKVKGITVTPASSSLVIGVTPSQTDTLTATLTYNGGDASPLGTVTTWPTVAWSSSDACITINPSTGTASATSPSVETVASLGTGAAAGQSSTITATVLSDFVKDPSSPVSSSATVKCVNPVTIKTVTLSSTSTTVWKVDNTVTTPTVTSVIGSDESELKDFAKVKWSYSDPSIAEVDEQGGPITLHKAGEIEIVATVSLPVSKLSPAGDSKQVVFTVYSNEVTGITVSPSSVNVFKGSTTPISATLTKTSYGTALSDPTISWASATPANVSIPSGATGASVVATGVNKGSSVVSATIDSDYLSASATLNNTCTVTCVTPSMTAFRGYEVSAGILERSKSGDDPATYSLTAGEMVCNTDPATGAKTYSLPTGCNPFEPAVYFKKSSSLDTYFNQWQTLRSELGEDGNNISSTSPKLPTGWQFPTAADNTASDWGKIIFGAPKSTITVNGTAVTSNAYAMISVSLDAGNPYSVSAGTYYGLLLLRDGTTIPAGILNTIGSGSKFTDNQITMSDFQSLIQLGCLFISVSGCYHNELGWIDLNDSWKYGFYWSSIFKATNNYYQLDFDQSGAVSVRSASNSSQREYKVVKLVKPVTE